MKDAVGNARDALYKAQRAMQEIDAEALVAAVQAATTAVEAALITAEQESVRVQAISELDADEKACDEAEHAGQEAALMDSDAFVAALSAAREIIDAARGAASYPDVAVLQGEVDKATSAVTAVEHLLEAEQRRRKEEQKNRFLGNLAVFQQGEKKNAEKEAFQARRAPRAKVRQTWVKEPVEPDDNCTALHRSSQPVCEHRLLARPTFAAAEAVLLLGLSSHH